MTPASASRLSPSVDNANDTEITLGTGKMLALFFGLVILCAVFFGMGFSMGRNSVKSAPELLPSPNPSGVRPAAGNKPPTPIAAPESKAASQTSPSDTSSAAGASVPSGQAATAASPTTGYFVQVAAVSKQEDAEALVESLKGRQYSAFISNTPPDKFFHVQVGPFSDIKDAEGMRAKLVSDGYSPILKK